MWEGSCCCPGRGGGGHDCGSYWQMKEEKSDRLQKHLGGVLRVFKATSMFSDSLGGFTGFGI